MPKQTYEYRAEEVQVAPNGLSNSGSVRPVRHR